MLFAHIVVPLQAFSKIIFLMHRFLFFYFFIFLFSLSAHGFTTAGNGKTYSFAQLAETEGTGVRIVDGCYIVEQNDTIAAGDTFQLDENTTVKFADRVTFVIQGEARLNVNGQPTTLTRLDESATPYSIKIDNEHGAEVGNVVFEYLGLETVSRGATHVANTTFRNHNGSSAAALYFIASGQPSTVSHCTFEKCQKAAIGSSANASQPLTIQHCTLLRNSTRNGNIPQINITASRLLIDDCLIEGDTASLTANNMVGGIGISNFAGFTDTQTTITNCTISHNRYGIGTVGPIDIRIDGNTIRDNNHEANPMNGGSGISLYDPYQKTTAVIANNIIEGNHWGVTIIGCKDVNLGQPSNQAALSPGGNRFSRNGCLGQLYDLYNNSRLTVYAQNNTWGVDQQTEEMIETVIFHQADDEKLGPVIFMPANNDAAAIPTLTQPTHPTAHVYDLKGRKTQSVSAHGIYIRDGKKFFR